MTRSSPDASFTLQDRKCTVAAICLLLAAVVLLTFGQSRNFGFVNFDDAVYYSSNYYVKAGLTWAGFKWAFQTGYASNWHPLTWLSLMLDAQLFGPGPAGPHFTNVLLHAINAVVLFLLFRRLTGALWPSAVVAALFAVHPLRVESVVWISERKDVLSGLFFLLTLGAYALFVEKSKAQNPKSKLFYTLCLLAFVCGLMCKPMLVTLPLVLLLLDYWPLNRFTPSALKRLLIEKIPFFILSAASCIVTMLAQQQAIKPMGVLPLPLRLSNAVIAYITYLLQMIWPHNLAVLYPYRFNPPNWQVAGACILMLCITFPALLMARRFPYFLTGWLWYLGMLVPTIGLVQVGEQAHADRYTYLPQIGLYLIVVWATKDFSVSWHIRRRIPVTLTFVLIGILMVCTLKQTAYWRNEESLWKQTIACTTGNYLAHNDLGYVLAAKGRIPEAIEHYQKAIEIDPTCADAYNNLGTIYLNQGQLDEAARLYHRAIDIYPSFAEAYNNLGILLMKQGRPAEAIEQFQKALELEPDNAEIQNNLANVFTTQGRADEAIEHYRQALAQMPDSVHAHYQLGFLLQGRGEFAASVAQFQMVLELDPKHVSAQNNLAWLLATCPDNSVRNGTKAIELAQQAVQLSGGEASEILDTLAAAYAEAGRFSEAIATANRALSLASLKNNKPLADAIQTQLKFYEAGTPFRDISTSASH